jgi:hypothetical protein
MLGGVGDRSSRGILGAARPGHGVAVQARPVRIINTLTFVYVFTGCVNARGASRQTVARSALGVSICSRRCLTIARLFPREAWTPPPGSRMIARPLPCRRIAVDRCKKNVFANVCEA